MTRIALLLAALSLWCITPAVAAPPSAPAMTYSTSGQNLTISWAAVPGAAGYTLSYAPYPYNGEAIGSADMGTATSIAFQLWPGAAYYLAVQAYDSQRNHGAYSNLGFFIIEHYGSDCLSCHAQEATQVHGSVHYQWQGPAPYMVNQPGTPQGKLTNAVNSYCINILGNWTGCSACHVGKGARPEAVATPAQLANIDCLKCHSWGGRKPTRANCLTCHARAGGGDAVKRGDLALATGSTTDRNYDVHMATTGANLQCQSCHTTRDHRIAGKGSDLRATDLDVKVDCTNCHNAAPHGNADINKHTARVACQTCHIPVYAKNAADTAASEATETFRTWRRSDATQPPLRPAAQLANNLTPRYRFWNGTSNNYLLGDVAQRDPATGRYPTSRPIGSVSDGKLYPFKYKTAEQPMTSGSNLLIPLDTSVFFATADPAAAVRQGLSNAGLSENTPWEWVETDTFQLLNHQVSPHEQALRCANCHDNTSRMDLQGALGYQLKAAKSTVCSQCHGNKNSSGYAWVHNKHVAGKRYDCSWCHTFSRPERGLRLPPR